MIKNIALTLNDWIHHLFLLFSNQLFPIWKHVGIHAQYFSLGFTFFFIVALFIAR